MEACTIEPAHSVPEQPKNRDSLALELGSPIFLVERAAIGLALSLLFGLALGMHRGGLALLTHALAIPGGLLLTTCVSIPSLYIMLSMLGAPLRLELLLAAVSTAIHYAGRVLAGLSPIAALLVVTIREPIALALVAKCGLELAGVLSLYRLVAAVRQANAASGSIPVAAQTKYGLVLCGFVVLALNLAQMAFSTLLPVLRGVS
jgi:hypothetical protein